MHEFELSQSPPKEKHCDYNTVIITKQPLGYFRLPCSMLYDV